MIRVYRRRHVALEIERTRISMESVELDVHQEHRQRPQVRDPDAAEFYPHTGRGRPCQVLDSAERRQRP